MGPDDLEGLSAELLRMLVHAERADHVAAVEELQGHVDELKRKLAAKPAGPRPQKIHPAALKSMPMREYEAIQQSLLDGTLAVDPQADPKEWERWRRASKPIVTLKDLATLSLKEYERARALIDAGDAILERGE